MCGMRWGVGGEWGSFVFAPGSLPTRLSASEPAAGQCPPNSSLSFCLVEEEVRHPELLQLPPDTSPAQLVRLFLVSFALHSWHKLA